MKKRFIGIIALAAFALGACAISEDEAFRRGLDYEYGQAGKPQDDARALAMYRKAAEMGHVGAQNNLADFIYEGRGTQQDRAEAARWYRRAAEQGSARAQNKLGDIYRFGHGASRDYAEAVYWYALAAEQGHVGAFDNLNFMLLNGLGTPQDYNGGTRWTDGSAGSANYRARHKLAHVLEHRGDAEAVKLLTALAQTGYPGAQAHLGRRYEKGRGVPQDIEAAQLWYRRGAEGGDISAQKDLGAMYLDGAEAGRDTAQAFKWLTIALNTGQRMNPEHRDYFRTEIEETTNLLAQARQAMTSEEIAEAEKQAAEWIAKHEKAE
ncbi:MAG: sel1 repeat family protein [Nitrospinaceae bacterium]|nr:MAG: sel1 repeat family protein [Nitrospinaceae bacterium]